MKLAIDLLPCLTDSRDRGIGRYTLSLVEAICQECRSDEVVLAADATDVTRLSELRRVLHARRIDLPVRTYSYPGSVQVDQSPQLSSAASLLKARFFDSLGADVALFSSLFEFGGVYSSSVECSYMRNTASAVIAYDLIPLRFQAKYLPKGSVVADWYTRRLQQLKKFDLLLAISESTRADLIALASIPDDRVRVVGAGFDDSLASAQWVNGTDLAGTHLKYGIHRPYVLTVSNCDWRKNTLGAVEAFAALPESDRKSHQLVLTQVGDDVIDALAGRFSHLRDDVVICGKVSDRELAWLYAGCKLFFFPSLFEGFGLPVLEAMAFGVPVISSNAGALPEVVPNRKMLFDPCDKRAMVGLLQQALRSSSLRAELASGAREHAMLFTWKRAALASLEALRETCRSRERRTRFWAATWIASARETSLLADALEAVGGDEGPLRRSLMRVFNKRRRLLIDVSEVSKSDARTGIQRVVRNIARECSLLGERFGCSVELVRWAGDRMVYARSFARDRLGLELLGDDSPVEVEVDDIALMLDSSWLEPERFDRFHNEIRQSGGEVVWMVYDLIPLLHPDTCDPGMPPAFHRWLSHVASTADGFVCISEATRSDLKDFILEQSPDCIEEFGGAWARVLHLGCDIEAPPGGVPSPGVEQLISSLGDRKMFLSVGTVEPRKNHRTVVEAFEHLWDQGGREVLVIVGKQGWRVDEIATRIRTHPALGSNLFWLEDASDADLDALYSGAFSLIQASTAEGFGLPIVEAAKRGVPILLSRIPVFEEIAGEGGWYFDPFAALDLASQVQRAVVAGRAPLAAEVPVLTWAQCAENLLSILMGAPVARSRSDRMLGSASSSSV